MPKFLLKMLFFILIACSAYGVSAEQNDHEYHEPPSFFLQWGFVHFPPLIFRDKDGQYKGELEELMTAVSLYSGIPYTPMEYPNLRAIFNLNQQKVNFAIGVRSLIKNEKQFLLSAFPVTKMQLLILWRTDTAPVTTIEDLAGKKLILLNGYTYGGLRTTFEEISASYMDVEHHTRAISALTLNRGDYALVYQTANKYKTVVAVQKEFEQALIGEVELYFILNRKAPRAKQVMQRLEQAFLRYQATLGSKSESIKFR